MALSYSAILRVPTTRVFTSIDYLQFWEFSSGASSAFLTIPEVLASAKSLLEALFGGTFSWITSSDATNNIYTISWTGLTSDPENDPTYGNITALYYQDIGGDTGSAQFLSTSLCEATGSCEVCPPSVNPEDATDCPSCYDQSIAFCDSVIEILGLDASTEYDFKITDQATGKVYNYTATTDGFGGADLLTADFPTGLFTPYNGAFTISIFDVDGNPVILTYGYVNYSCIELTVTNTISVS